MNRLIVTILLVLLATGASAGVPILDAGYDRNAARDDLTNVTPATGRTSLSVYSKAEVSAAIATESADRLSGDNALSAALATKSLELSGHVASTGTAVHGLGTMAVETATNYAGATGVNIIADAFRAALGVYSTSELATVSANLTGSNITATSTFLSAIGGAPLNGSLAQPFQSEDMTVIGSFTHNLASGGYSVYQGNTKSSAAGQPNIELPLNWPWESISPASGTCGYVKVDVVGKRAADLAVSVIHFEAAFNKFNNILAFVGSPASITSSLNASDMKTDFYIKALNQFVIVATSTPGTLWQVKKFEIGGL